MVAAAKHGPERGAVPIVAAGLRAARTFSQERCAAEVAGETLPRRTRTMVGEGAGMARIGRERYGEQLRPIARSRPRKRESREQDRDGEE